VQLNPSTLAEVSRTVFAPHTGSVSSQGTARGLALDDAGHRAYVLDYGGGLVHIVDTSNMTEVDSDGNAANGITPVSFGATHLYPQGIAIDPASGDVYVTFGHLSDFAVGTFSPSAPSVITYLATTITSGAGGVVPKFGPDGRLWVPHTQYEQTNNTGLSVWDLGASTEDHLGVVNSNGNNDCFSVAFIPFTNEVWLALDDNGVIDVYDTTTLQAIDADGDAANGVSSTDGSGSMYGNQMSVTPY
jgi:DNA-binding beta-propeller fold protein YncE